MKALTILHVGLVTAKAALAQSPDFVPLHPPKFESLEEKMLRRASKITIQSLDLKDVPFAKALDILRRKTREDDLENSGIRIEPAP